MRHAILFFFCETLHAKLLIKLSLNYTSQQCVMMMEEACIAALHVVGLAARISANFRKKHFPATCARKSLVWVFFGLFVFCDFLCVVFSDQTSSEAVQGTTLLGMQV